MRTRWLNSREESVSISYRPISMKNRSCRVEYLEKGRGAFSGVRNIINCDSILRTPGVFMRLSTTVPSSAISFDGLCGVGRT